MATTLVQDLSDQIQKFWSPLFKDELKESALLPALVDRAYQGDLKAKGDTVKVTQWQVGEATQKGRDSGGDTFHANKLGEAQINITANQIFYHAFEFQDLVTVQTQLENPESELRTKMMAAISRKMNAYLYGLVAPSASTPDHQLGSVSAFDEDALLAVRALASQSHWGDDDRFCVLDPIYYNNILKASGLSSRDFGPDTPKVAGRYVTQRYGFNLVEDDSSALLGVKSGSADKVGLAFRRDFIHLVLGNAQWKISDLHSNKQFGYLMSLSIVGGAARGHDHAKLCILTTGAA